MICDLCGVSCRCSPLRLMEALSLLHRAEERRDARRTDATVDLLRGIDEAMTSVSQRMRGLTEDYERAAKLLEEP